MLSGSQGVSELTESTTSRQREQVTVRVATKNPESSPPETTALYPHPGQANSRRVPINPSRPAGVQQTGRTPSGTTWSRALHQRWACQLG